MARPNIITSADFDHEWESDREADEYSRDLEAFDADDDDNGAAVMDHEIAHMARYDSHSPRWWQST